MDEIIYDEFKRFEQIFAERGLQIPVDWGEEGSFSRKKAQAFIWGLKKGMEENG